MARLLSLALLGLGTAGLLATSSATNPVPRREFRPAAGAAAVAAFSPDGHLLGLVGTAAAAVGVYETRTGLLLRTYAGHAQPVADVAFAAVPDTAVSADTSGLVRAWNPETLAPLISWQAPVPVLFVRVVPGGNRVLLVAATQVWLWNLRRPAVPPVPQRLALPAKARITAVAASADSSRFALGLASGQALVQRLGPMPAPGKTKAPLPPPAGLHNVVLATTPIQDMYFGHDTLYAAASTPALLRWVPTGTTVLPELPLPEPLTSVEADGPDHLAVLGFASGQVAVWHLGRNAPTYTCRGNGPARQARFQPLAGGLVMARYEGQDVKTWKVW